MADQLWQLPRDIAFSPLAWLSLIAILASALYSRSRSSLRNKLPLPPGPPTLPIIGNLHNVPIDGAWRVFHDLGKSLGGCPVLYARILDQAMVVVNSHEAAQEIFHRHAANYSDRPRAVLVEAMEGAAPFESSTLIARSYDATFRLHQRMIAPSMAAPNMARFHALMGINSAQLVQGLLEKWDKRKKSGVEGEEEERDNDADDGWLTTDSDALTAYLLSSQTGFILGASYARLAQSPDDPWLARHVRQHSEFLEVLVPSPLDVLRFLARLPLWLTPWGRAALRVRRLEAGYASDLRDALAVVDSQPGSGNKQQLPIWSLARQAHSVGRKHGVPDTDVAKTVAMNAIAGSETTPKAVAWLLLALLSHPAAAREAHASVDRAVGRDRRRLPGFGDRPALVYVEAAILETMRWRPLVPFGVPHRARAEAEYAGLRIPAGATMLANTWAIGRDPAAFPGDAGHDLDAFRPDRWLDYGVAEQETQAGNSASDGDGESFPAPFPRLRHDLPTAIFGYGRRTCPGRRVAEDGLFLQVSRLLWAFDFALDPASPPLDTETMRPNSITAEPTTFRLRLRPRGPWVRDVIAEEVAGIDLDDLRSVLGTMDES